MLVFLSLLQAASSAAPSPPIITQRVARFAPPVADAPLSPATVDVEIRAGRTQLWTGSLRVVRNQSADFNRTLSQAPTAECLQGARDRQPEQRDHLSVRLNRDHSDSTQFRFSIAWQRPVSACPAVEQSRSASISGQVALVTGTPTIVAGDGDLTARFTLR